MAIVTLLLAMDSIISTLRLAFNVAVTFSELTWEQKLLNIGFYLMICKLVIAAFTHLGQFKLMPHSDTSTIFWLFQILLLERQQGVLRSYLLGSTVLKKLTGAW